MPDIVMVILVTAVISTINTSLFEWTLHKYVMHRPLGKFDYPFRAHALVHHQIFKADKTYHLDPAHPENKKTIPMAWWNGPALIAIGLIPYVIAGILLHHFIVIPLTSLAVFSLYYGAYEYFHWCMHLPRARRLEFSWLFRRLNGHHLLHHRYMGKNFNVVLPLADLLLGTLILRSKLRFAQATGPSVPDVQPRTLW